MPLPQPVLEQLSRRPTRESGWSGRLLIFAVTVLVIVVVLYLGLLFIYQPYLDKQVQALNQQIQNFAKELPSDDQAKTVTFYGQLDNIHTLLGQHVLPSGVMGWLEQHTLPSVYYSRVSLNSSTRKLILASQSANLQDAAKQLSHFQSLPEVESSSFASASFADNVWKFEITLVLSDKLLKP